MTSTTPEPSSQPVEEPKPFNPLEFPPDLLGQQRALDAAYEALHAFSAEPTLPWSAEPHEGWDDTRSGKWRETAREKTDGWAEEQHAEYARLWAEVQHRAIMVSCHRHWSEVPKEKVVEARQALKQAALKPLDVAQAA
jgi:hypothetical protein